ncbi:VOC family protein [Vibrio sp. 14N.309.X.WAT.E.F5]|uniref:VOC family protein n=1 Tax=Vibrio sp. 14N.309.X.WAT.E.F5 TaxID=2998321 RepID=UPI0025B0DA5E|nr:VOC family protein [Vibrio sp. 14N.309.X.WAT.E.F5]MDN2665175.1 VOC family protein [Vibrio sp. 14N.309.X.WAT.E.F5]
MQMNPIGWFEIYVDDMMRAKAFYEAVFNVTLDKLDVEAEMDVEMWVFPCDMDSYGATGALCYMSHVKAGGNSTMVYFSCEDCATEASRAEENGGALQVPKMAIGQHGFISIVSDSEGNMIGLHSMQ